MFEVMVWLQWSTAGVVCSPGRYVGVKDLLGNTKIGALLTSESLTYTIASILSSAAQKAKDASSKFETDTHQ
jgi:hypothetical protein